MNRLWRRLWAAPCSGIGLLLIGLLWPFGARVQRRDGLLLATWRADEDKGGRGALARRLPWRAITLGHVIVAVTADDLRRLEAHERVHVAQYERWGLLFFPAYALASLWQLLRGRRPYWDNVFEVEARRLGDDVSGHGRGPG